MIPSGPAARRGPSSSATAVGLAAAAWRRSPATGAGAGSGGGHRNDGQQSRPPPVHSDRARRALDRPAGQPGGACGQTARPHPPPGLVQHAVLRVAAEGGPGGWGEGDDVVRRAAQVEVEEAAVQRRVRGALPEQLHLQRQPGGRIRPDVDARDRRRGIRGDQPQAQGIAAGDPGGADAGESAVAGLGEQPAAESGGQQVRWRGQGERQALGARDAIGLVLPGPATPAVAVNIGLTTGGHDVDPGVVGTAPPDPHRRPAAEQVRDGGERVGHRQRQAAGGLGVAGEADGGAGQYGVPQISDGDVGVGGRERADSGGESGEDGDQRNDERPAPCGAVPLPNHRTTVRREPGTPFLTSTVPAGLAAAGDPAGAGVIVVRTTSRVSTVRSGHASRMAAISDAVVVDVLRRFARLATPLVRRLGRPTARPQDERDAWWAEQVSEVAAGVAAAPRLAGKLADLLPLQNTVGAAVQSIVVLGVTGEHKVTDPAERVSLLARVLLGRDLRVEQVRPLLDRTAGTYREEAFGATGTRAGILGTVRTVWRLSRLLSRIDEALDGRPKGKLRHRALANLPLVGVLGGYAAEREGLRRAAMLAATTLEGQGGVGRRSRSPGTVRSR